MDNRNQAAIGVFDSGLGGLTVVRELVRALPDEPLVYFGDTARVPYGSKTKETIIHYTDQILAFLKTKEVKAIVVACNTVSAYGHDALEELKSRTPVPIVEVVKPGARAAVSASLNGKIGVTGTAATVRSGIYESFIKSINPDIRVFQKACPLFVPLAEEGWWDDPVTKDVAERYLRELREQDVDTLIMGCTHYPLIRKTIGEVMGEKVTLINPAYETAQEARRMLESSGLLKSPGEEPEHFPKYRFYVSDGPERFSSFAQAVLGKGPFTAEKINIEAY